MMSSAGELQRRARRCPRGGRDGHPATHLDTVAGQRQVQRSIERMQIVLTARRTPRTRNLHCAGGRFRVAFVFTPLRALATAIAGALDRTGGLPRAGLAAMLLQELAYQLLVSPVQFPFEVTLAHLAGFARGEEGFGLGEDGLGRARRRVAGSDAGDDGSHLLRVERTSRELRRHHGHCQTCLPSQTSPDTVPGCRGNVQGWREEAIDRSVGGTGNSVGLAARKSAGGGVVPPQCALNRGRQTA